MLNGTHQCLFNILFFRIRFLTFRFQYQLVILISISLFKFIFSLFNFLFPRIEMRELPLLQKTKSRMLALNRIFVATNVGAHKGFHFTGVVEVTSLRCLNTFVGTKACFSFSRSSVFLLRVTKVGDSFRVMF